MNDIDKTIWGTGKSWKSASLWRRYSGRVIDWNEFAEWHVAWLAEWHNYAECNIYRMTQRNKFNSKAALFLEPIWRSSQCVTRLISIGLSTRSMDDDKCTEETSSSSVYGGGYITVGFTKLNWNRKQASRHFSIVSHPKKQHLTMTLFPFHSFKESIYTLTENIMRAFGVLRRTLVCD